MPTPLLVFLYGLSVLGFLAFLYPYIGYPLTLRWLRDKPLAVDKGEPTAAPSFSLLFCAYNEIAVMEAKLANLRALKQACPTLEILAYDDASTDGTWEALTAEPELLLAVRGSGRTGKAHGMKILAARASHDNLVFTDANVIVDPGALRTFAETYRDESIGGICGTLRYSTTSETTGGAATSTESVGDFYWKLEERIKELESRTGNVMGADGSIFSVRRSLYPDFPDTVQDDFTVSMNVIFAGFRLVRCADAVAYEALVSSSQEEFRRKIRIAARAYHTHLHLRPHVKRLPLTDRYKYVSHKLLRWHSATSLTVGVGGLALALAAHIGLALVGLGLATAVLLLGIASLVARSLVSQALEVLLALLATNWGAWQALRGRTYQTWQPPTR